MGLFKQMKDMKATVERAPDMVRAAQAMSAQAQEMAAAQRAAAAAQTPTFGQPGTAPAAGVSDAELTPIAGVSLELYAEISKGLAQYGYDQSRATEVAASKGVSPESWSAAVAGWNERMKQNRAVGQEFNRLYTGR